MSVLHLITQRPHLLLEHVDAYSDLFAQEMTHASRAWTYRAILGLAAIVLICGAGILAGVGFMLWAVMPPEQIHAPWLLWATPILPLVAGLTCAQVAKKHLQNRVFSDFRLQIKGDLALLREISVAK